ncbi:hypothetical protein BDW42DRAFT_170924 [Aspergillus taichungensis]|uniref:Uncharacterized protein n=1 Tax=Aspergillus taichungensis TaxID=482145 RepID=A0A2J5HT04_9EURO|nr:hypothetical protein BDW42DRAFT_170924 [Aspergillus taichungensis]
MREVFTKRRLKYHLLIQGFVAYWCLLHLTLSYLDLFVLIMPLLSCYTKYISLEHLSN